MNQPSDAPSEEIESSITEEKTVPVRIDIRDLEEPLNESLSPSARHAAIQRAMEGESKKPFQVEPGTAIGEYVIKEKVGQGGVGEIWKAHHPLINKQVAVKVLRGKIAADQEAVERFIREAKAVNDIKHKALIDIFSFGDLPDGRPYFVMEYLQGRSLYSYIEEEGPLPWSEILEIFTQLCEALEATHQQGIIHRDLKSENLFLLKEPNKPILLKVLDFGVAKLINPTGGDAQLTQNGVIMGTPAYMSPEQCKGEVTYLSDIYSIGIILFEAITGRTPFVEPNMKATEVMIRQLNDPAPAPSTVVKGRAVPSQVDDLVLRILSKDPDERPSSCGLLADLLKQIIGPLVKREPQGSTKATPIYFPRLKKQGLAKKTRRYVLSAAIGGASILGVVLLSQVFGPSPAVSAQVQIKEVIKEVAAIPTRPAVVQLSVGSNPPGAQVFWGGKLLGETPLETELPYEMAPAKLSIKKKGYQPYEQELIVQSAESFVYWVGLEKVGSKFKSRLVPKPPETPKEVIEAPKEKPTVKTKLDPGDHLAPSPFGSPK